MVDAKKIHIHNNSSECKCSVTVVFMGDGMDHDFSSITFTVDILLISNDVNMYCSYHFGFLFCIFLL